VIRVLLADDHALVRAGLRALLKELPGIEVVAEAGDGREAIEQIKRHQPGVVLMDIAMPGLNGLDTAALITKDHPGVRVVVLSVHTEEAYVLRALRAGAAGYLSKGATLAELELAVNTAARGDTYLSPSTSKQVVEYLRRGEGGPRSLDTLTPRHREILQLIAEGRTSKEISAALGISAKTVETHRTGLMDRLGIHDIAGLVRYAIGVGLVAPAANPLLQQPPAKPDRAA
jgi:DNA-binding NarL/FixJ family response regulator